MKKILLLILTGFIAWACNNNQPTQTVQPLTEKWTATNAEVQRLANAMNNGYLHWKAVQDTMALPPGSLQKLDNATRQEVQALLKNMQEYGRNYVDLGRDFNVFFKQWEERKQHLDKVTTVVNYKQKSELDIPAELATLQAVATDANTKATQWTTQLQALDAKIEADFEQFKQKTASIQ